MFHKFPNNFLHLITRETLEDAEIIRDIITSYEYASGQNINLVQSKVSFNGNLSDEKKQVLQLKLSFFQFTWDSQ